MTTSYPNLLKVLEWSAVGSPIAISLSSDEQQKFFFGAILGILSNYQGYKYANFDYPDYALPLAGILCGFASVKPIPALFSLVLAALVVPTYLTFKTIYSEDQDSSDIQPSGSTDN